jgi:hypothetical protein
MTAPIHTNLWCLKLERKPMKFVEWTAAALALAFASQVAAAPTLAGDTVDAAMIRTVDNGYGLGRVVGYGLEGPFVVVNGPSDGQQYSEHFVLNIDGEHFSIDFLGQFSSGWQEGTVLRLSDLDFFPTSFLTGLDVDTNLVGYTLTLGADFIDIGLGGTEFSGATFFDGTFRVSQVTAIPEPSTLVLMLAGLLGVASLSHRGRRRV